jgi:hypothetical protein
MTVKRKFVDALAVKSFETKETTDMFGRLEVPREVVEQIKRLETELDPPKPLVQAGEKFGIVRHTDPNDLRAKRWSEAFGAATKPPEERPELKATADRLKLLAITNPAAALREAQYLSGEPNPLLNYLPPKSERSSDRVGYNKTKLLQDTMSRIENFHYFNGLLHRRGYPYPIAVPIVKAKLVEQNSHHKQALEENDPWGTAGIFSFKCPYCGQDHLIGVSVPEWHSRKTLPKEIYCTPNGSAHLIAFELEGIEG